MSKPIEEMAGIFWEAMLRQIEDRIEERIEAAIANIPRRPIAATEQIQRQELARRDRPSEYFISPKEVCAMVGLSRSTIYKLENEGTFPKKIRLSQYVVRYRVGDIRGWMNCLERTCKAKKDNDSAILTERQQQRLMRLALNKVPKPKAMALPYYKMGDVMKLTGFTHSQIYDGVKDGSFPIWKKTGWPAQQWDRGTVDTWIEARKTKKK